MEKIAEIGELVRPDVFHHIRASEHNYARAMHRGVQCDYDF